MRRDWVRFIYYLLAGFIVGLLLQLIFPHGKSGQGTVFFHFLTTIVITALVWEGNLVIDNQMNRYLPWLKSPGRRILVHLPVSMIYSSVAIFSTIWFFDTYVCTMPASIRDSMMPTSIAIGLIITIAILATEIGSQFFYKWKQSLVEIEKYKAESIQAQLSNLKEQVNPHFLFNNLSVLSSLVYKDQDKAVDFINQLSKVYRYILDTRNNELITLEEEFRFIESYTYLLQIRYGKNISFKFDVPAHKYNLLLPPLALQLLIENAIKHNEVSADYPLHLSIEEFENVLEVKNNLQVRHSHEKSSGTGLNNIRQRYRHYTDRMVEVVNDGRYFVVRIPLLLKG